MRKNKKMVRLYLKRAAAVSMAAAVTFACTASSPYQVKAQDICPSVFGFAFPGFIWI